MKMSGSQIVVALLESAGIKTVAGIPGGSILPLYDELNGSSIKHILVRHEQAAGFIAQGMARSTGVPAVCLATSGPGAMNLLTAVADARCDSVPIIAITGQVNLSLIGTDAFQEADTFGLSFPITKHSVMVKSAKELLSVIPEAFEIAMNGRPGPVLIDIPRNVQLEVCEFDELPNIKTVFGKDNIRFMSRENELPDILASASDLILAAEHPVLFAGGGCNNPKGALSVRNFLKCCPMPVTSSLMGLGVISTLSEAFAGMVGMHGSFAANSAMYDSDLVIACGVRFDDRATGLVSKFCPNAKIIHIDIDAAEINKILPANCSVVGRVEEILPELEKIFKSRSKTGFAEKNSTDSAKKDWLKKIISIKKENYSLSVGTPSDEKKRKGFEGSKNPRIFIAELPTLAAKAGLLQKDILVTTDVGQHQMWAAQYYPVLEPEAFLTSGSLGTMGFGLPAAIGAALANPSKRVICFSGDGSIMMNIQELATLAEENLAVTVIVFENGTLGMVYQQQKFLFDKHYSASQFSVQPDLLKIAEGFGIMALDADSDSNWYMKAFDMNRQNKPCFVRVRIDPEEEVLPFVPGGKANIDCIRN